MVEVNVKTFQESSFRGGSKAFNMSDIVIVLIEVEKI
jgi:hypothetical protein